MDPILQTLLSWQFIIFALSIASIVFVVRKIVEYRWVSKQTKWWSELVLPIFPVALGPVVAYVFKSFPYPDSLTTTGDRIIFGLVAGFLSNIVYRVVKSLFGQKITAAVQGFVQGITGTTNVPTTTTVVSQNIPQIPSDQISERGRL